VKKKKILAKLQQHNMIKSCSGHQCPLRDQIHYTVYDPIHGTLRNPATTSGKSLSWRNLSPVVICSQICTRAASASQTPPQVLLTSRLGSSHHLNTILSVRVWRLFFKALATASGPSTSYKIQRLAQWRYLTVVLFCTLLPAGCTGLPSQFAGKVRYENPPAVGSWLQSQRELVACETVLAARYMADFGFFHPQCKQLLNIGPKDYLVESRKIIQLREGPMWLLNVKHQNKVFFVPIPWHNWV